MAANLLRAGYVVRAWNRSPAPLGKLAALGAQAAASPAEARRGRRCAGVHAGRRRGHALCGAGGRRAGRAGPGAVHVNMATVSVALAAELARLHGERGVCGGAGAGPGQRGRGRPAQYPGGRRGAALLLVQPLFDAMGRKTWYFGERPEQANAVKLAVNFMIGSAIGAMSEAVALVRGYDVDKAAFLEMATSTAFAAPVYQGYGQAIAEERFEPAGFKLALGLKDLRLAQKRPSRCTCRCNWPACCAMRTSRAWRAARASWTGPPCRARRRGGPGWSKASGRAAPDQAGAARAAAAIAANHK